MKIKLGNAGQKFGLPGILTRERDNTGILKALSDIATALGWKEPAAIDVGFPDHGVLA